MISFLNYRNHPDEREKRVFYYRKPEPFGEMKELLVKAKVNYEERLEDDGTPTFYIIVHRDDFDEASHCNTMALTKFKQPVIQDTALRYFLIALFILLTGVALTGYIVTNFF